MTSSGDSRHSEAAAPAIAFLLGVTTALAAWFCYTHGYILYYGDAQAHLNNSRGIIDSRTPGYEQIGTVWLPLLHLLCLPFVRVDRLWSNGLAGTIPVATCFVVGGTCLFLTARKVYDDGLAAAISVACFALNPNVLYLSVIPMTELVFLGGLFVLLLALAYFRESQKGAWVVVGVVAGWAMSLTRYDGWFLIPFAALWFAAFALPERRVRVFILIAGAASVVPIYWAAHCWWETGNALDFFNGPYSAKTIQAGKPYPGYHDWTASFQQYASAGRLCAGAPLILVGVCGAAAALARQRFAIPAFLLLTPGFYIWSLHSSGNPIFVPSRWPYSYYNTRYGIAVVALAAMAAGAMVLVLPTRGRKLSWLIPVLALSPWITNPTVDNVICWKESQVNSEARRAWTGLAATFLRRHYQSGTGVLASFGDLTGIFCHAGIPLKETLHEGNGPAWFAAIKRADLLPTEAWAIVQHTSRTEQALRNTGAYVPCQTIEVPKAPPIDILKRHDTQHPFP